MARAPDSKSDGWGFESPLACQFLIRSNEKGKDVQKGHTVSKRGQKRNEQGDLANKGGIDKLYWRRDSYKLSVCSVYCAGGFHISLYYESGQVGIP